MLAAPILGGLPHRPGLRCPGKNTPTTFVGWFHATPWLPWRGASAQCLRDTCGGDRDVSSRECQASMIPSPTLGNVEMIMEASLCPMCSRALKICTIEPHPIRDGVDVVMYRCPIHGDIWRSIVLNQVEAADTEIATLLPP